MNYDINALLDLIIQENASDLHIHVGRPPSLRIAGDIHPVQKIRYAQDTDDMRPKVKITR